MLTDQGLDIYLTLNSTNEIGCYESHTVPVTLSLKKTAATHVNIAGRYDTFAMCDCIIYIDLMGRITTRI